MGCRSVYVDDKVFNSLKRRGLNISYHVRQHLAVLAEANIENDVNEAEKFKELAIKNAENAAIAKTEHENEMSILYAKHEAEKTALKNDIAILKADYERLLIAVKRRIADLKKQLRKEKSTPGPPKKEKNR